MLTWSIIVGGVADAVAKNESNNGQGNSSNDGSGNATAGVDQGKSNEAGENKDETNANQRTGDAVRVTRSTIEVRHRVGIEERIRNGRYLMRDKRGRTIINRPVTNQDLDRLRSFLDNQNK